MAWTTAFARACGLLFLLASLGLPHPALGRIGYNWVIRPLLGLEPGGLLEGTHAGGSIEAARNFGSFDPCTPDGWHCSVSLSVGAVTLIGPTFLGYGRGEAGNRALRLFLGRPRAPR